MKNSYCVYMHLCPNGKVYIGMTGRDPDIRFQNGNGYRNNPHFNQAIQKYGWDAIQHSILKCGLNREEAMMLEKSYIAEFQSSDPRYGYNMTYGGESGPKLTDYVKQEISRKLKEYYSTPEHKKEAAERATGHRHSAETRKKMSEAHKNPSDEVRAKMRAASTGRKFPNRIRTPHTELTKRKISEAKKGKHFGGIGKKPKAVLCVETGIVYGSAIEASKILGKDYTSIYKCCCGKRKQAHGYTWRYAI